MSFSLQAAAPNNKDEVEAMLEQQKEMAKTFGKGRISKQDVAFYIQYYGDPTEAPGPRFGMQVEAGVQLYHKWLDVQRRIVLRLSTGDFKAFVKCVQAKKKGNGGGVKVNHKKLLQELVNKILKCTDADKEKIAATKLKQNLPINSRVRLGTKRGHVVQCLLGGAMYMFISDQEKKNKDVRQPEMVPSEAVTPLCAGCGEEDGMYNCSKCKVVS